MRRTEQKVTRIFAIFWLRYAEYSLFNNIYFYRSFAVIGGMKTDCKKAFIFGNIHMLRGGALGAGNAAPADLSDTGCARGAGEYRHDVSALHRRQVESDGRAYSDHSALSAGGAYRRFSDARHLRAYGRASFMGGYAASAGAVPQEQGLQAPR